MNKTIENVKEVSNIIKKESCRISDINKLLKELKLNELDVVSETLLTRVNKEVAELITQIKNSLSLLDKTEIEKKYKSHRFDIQIDSGKIIIGLYSSSRDEIEKMYTATDDHIRILREIDEYGNVIWEDESYYKGSVCFNVERIKSDKDKGIILSSNNLDRIMDRAGDVFKKENEALSKIYGDNWQEKYYIDEKDGKLKFKDEKNDPIKEESKDKKTKSISKKRKNKSNAKKKNGSN